MSNQTGETINTTGTTESLKNQQERDRHLPTMPDPTHDENAEVRLPTDTDPSKKPPLTDEPQPIGDEDESDGLEQIA